MASIFLCIIIMIPFFRSYSQLSHFQRSLSLSYYYTILTCYIVVCSRQSNTWISKQHVDFQFQVTHSTVT